MEANSKRKILDNMDILKLSTLICIFGNNWTHTHTTNTRFINCQPFKIFIHDITQIQVPFIFSQVSNWNMAPSFASFAMAKPGKTTQKQLDDLLQFVWSTSIPQRHCKRSNKNKWKHVSNILFLFSATGLFKKTSVKTIVWDECTRHKIQTQKTKTIKKRSYKLCIWDTTPPSFNFKHVWCASISWILHFHGNYCSNSWPFFPLRKSLASSFFFAGFSKPAINGDWRC